MKVLFFHMDKCPHCIKQIKELKGLSEAKKFISIEKKNISTSQKTHYGIHKYPTIVFVNEKNKMLDKLEGFAPKEDIKQAYQDAERTNKIINKK
jgi:hypothetical protein